MNNNKHKLWVEKYRPQTLDKYIFHDGSQKKAFERMINDGTIPHLLLSGIQGSGKTTIAQVLINELGLDDTDVMVINASDENSVDVMRDKIKSFISTFAMNDFKVVHLEEADYISPNGQAVLRRMMEEYHDAARFILTCVTGDTRVYTPYGYKEIQTIQELDKVKAVSGDFLDTKAIRTSKSSNIYSLTTEHGINLKATGDHQLHTLIGPKRVDCLAENTTSVLSNIATLYGNSFEYERTPQLPDTSVEAFVTFLKNKGFATKEELNFLDKNSNFLFCEQHFEVVRDILKHDETTTFNVLDVAGSYNITLAQSRNILKKLQNYVNSKTQERHRYATYHINTTLLKEDYDWFVSSYEETYGSFNNKQLHRKWQQRLTQKPIEEFMAAFPAPLTDELLLVLGRLVGFMDGDGHISNCVQISANNEDTLNRVKCDLDKIKPTSTTARVVNNGKLSNGLKIQFSDVILQHVLEFFGAGLGNKTTSSKTVPSLCFKSKLFLKGYVQGYFDSDSIWTTLNSNRKTLNPITLVQNFTHENVDTDNSFEVLGDLLEQHFGIKTTVIKGNISTTNLTFGANLDRYVKKLQIIKQEDIKKYLLTIGNYYDKRTSDDYLGYLLYKENHKGGYGFLTFDQWKEKYYVNGFINDQVTSIKPIDADIVYDCCFEENHWYVTNGLCSHNCNYENKIIPAIKSRCQQFRFKAHDKDDVTEHIAQILLDEQVKFSVDLLDKYVSVGYPDIRKIIQLIQQNTHDGKLQPLQAESENGDYKFKLLELIDNGSWLEARKLACAEVPTEEWDDVYRFMYENLHRAPRFKEQDTWEAGITIIADHLYKDALCADREINAAAMFIRLGQQ